MLTDQAWDFPPSVQQKKLWHMAKDMRPRLCEPRHNLTDARHQNCRTSLWGAPIQPFMHACRPLSTCSPTWTRR